eukprot:TRINITY_DN1121_c0_g1_i2.p1 TRINITY_DN1121_c0_g1~~TRINITY_DN1121_c0_g1_i2.p1  ORF type:complete len:396 (-),score=61.73 TRINITY_DN1121_c0_g1_i2:113-1300(-)
MSYVRGRSEVSRLGYMETRGMITSQRLRSMRSSEIFLQRMPAKRLSGYIPIEKPYQPRRSVAPVYLPPLAVATAYGIHHSPNTNGIDLNMIEPRRILSFQQIFDNLIQQSNGLTASVREYDTGNTYDQKAFYTQPPLIQIDEGDAVKIARSRNRGRIRDKVAAGYEEGLQTPTHDKMRYTADIRDQGRVQIDPKLQSERVAHPPLLEDNFLGMKDITNETRRSTRYEDTKGKRLSKYEDFKSQPLTPQDDIIPRLPERKVYLNGDIYEGGMKNGLRDGYGVLIYSSGDKKYEGCWVEDKFSGEGKLYNKYAINVGRDFTFDYNDFSGLEDYWTSYEGTFSDGQIHGKGTIYLVNNEKFTGTFRKGKAHGEGVFYRGDGEIIFGKWNMNKFIAPNF